MGKSFETLSVQERMTYYRGMAAEALQLARTTEECEQKASFLDCAARWLALAHEVEHLQTHLAYVRKDLEALHRRTH